MKIFNKKPLDATHKKVAEELALKGVTGQTESEIAEANNINRSTLYRWKLRADFNDYLQSVADEFQRATLNDAYTVLQKLLYSDNEKTSIKAVELVLKNQGRLKDVQDTNVKVESAEMDLEAYYKEFGIKY